MAPHFLCNNFVDTIQATKKAYTASDAVVGSLLIDSGIQCSTKDASLLQGITWQKFLPATTYNKAGNWFKVGAGLNLIKLDAPNLLTIMIVALAITQQENLPNKPCEVQLGRYFQESTEKRFLD